MYKVLPTMKYSKTQLQQKSLYMLEQETNSFIKKLAKNIPITIKVTTRLRILKYDGNSQVILISRLAFFILKSLILLISDCFN
ncbi:UNKNOWN [Stylonychia lemnae]|uniref:Uncharacterized protein n=1 Tax=Stylonychia lemnae TaxID=5949 RepID=A0A077ZR25_STYLE|nr:UNKNOWN [Stylonychia lemnae]|eukprot:CDW72363.1 UNKNOWN [Stylonychia lemnae]